MPRRPGHRPRRFARLSGLLPLVGLLLIGVAVAITVYLRPDTLYLAAAVMGVACLALIIGLVFVRPKRPRAEPPDLPTLRGWIEAAEEEGDADAVSELLHRLRRWPHVLDDLGTGERARVGALVERTGAGSLLRRWAASNDRSRRIGALHLMTWLRHEDTEEVLDRSLADRDPEVAYAAASALLRLGSPSALERLVRILGGGRVPSSRIATLLENGDPEVLLPILRRHAEDPDSDHRFWIAHLVGRVDLPEALPLALRLSRDSHPDVRANAAEALGLLGESARDRLDELLDDPSWVVQAHAVEALGRIGAAASVDKLTELLFSPHWWVRERTLGALQQAGRAAEEPIRRLLPELRGEVRLSALDVLAAFE